ncbi:MAG TPA: hypothetical protein VIM56_06105 [Rhizomicrobium sp.]
MSERVTAEELREILSVARKLRIRARDELDEDYVDLFLRAAAALEQRARLLAFYPVADAAPANEDVIPPKSVNLIC